MAAKGVDIRQEPDWPSPSAPVSSRGLLRPGGKKGTGDLSAGDVCQGRPAELSNGLDTEKQRKERPAAAGAVCAPAEKQETVLSERAALPWSSPADLAPLRGWAVLGARASLDSRESDGGEGHQLQRLFQGRALLLVLSGVPVAVVAVLKLDPQLADLGLGEDVRDPLDDERRGLLLVRGSVA